MSEAQKTAAAWIVYAEPAAQTTRTSLTVQFAQAAGEAGHHTHFELGVKNKNQQKLIVEYSPNGTQQAALFLNSAINILAATGVPFRSGTAANAALAQNAVQQATLA